MIERRPTYMWQFRNLPPYHYIRRDLGLAFWSKEKALAA